MLLSEVGRQLVKAPLAAARRIEYYYYYSLAIVIHEMVVRCGRIALTFPTPTTILLNDSQTELL